MDLEERVVISLVALAVVLAACALWMAVDGELQRGRQYRADMAACQATGRAEWECRALLRGYGTTTVVPGWGR